MLSCSPADHFGGHLVHAVVHWQIYSIRWGDCVIAWPHGRPCAVIGGFISISRGWTVLFSISSGWTVLFFISGGWIVLLSISGGWIVILHIWRVDCVILHIWRVDCVILHIWRVDCVILHIWRVDCVIQGAYHGWREPHPHPHPNCIVHDRRFNIASVFLLVSVCCDTAQAKAGRLGDIFSWLVCVWVWHWESVICHCLGFADACAWWKHETDLCFVIFSACLRVMGMCLTTEASEAIMVESADLVKLAMVNLRTMRDDHSALFLFSWLDNLLGVRFCRICSVCIFFPLN